MAAIRFPDVLIASWLGLVALAWIKRIAWMRAFRATHAPLVPQAAPERAPKVTIIIPARNEEKNIARCLDHLSKQDYPDFTLVAVDDRSSDQTPQILARYRETSRVPLKVVRIEKLPPGWTGKNHAMFAGFRAADGEWILFTDADTTHAPQSLSTAMATALAQGLDFLTLAPETESVSFWEKTVQPLAVSSIAFWFDPIKVNDAKSGVVLANGQFILVKKSSYEKVGGNESVKSETVEDVELARKFRQAGLSVQFLDGTRLYRTRMYSSLKEIRAGWTRIFTHLFNKNSWAIAHKIVLFLAFSLSPFVVLALEKCWWLAGSARFDGLLLGLSAGLCAFIVLVRFIGNKMLKTNPWYAFLHPLASLVMIWILSACLYRIAFKRPSLWRGDAHPS